MSPILNYAICLVRVITVYSVSQMICEERSNSSPVGPAALEGSAHSELTSARNAWVTVLAGVVNQNGRPRCRVRGS